MAAICTEEKLKQLEEEEVEEEEEEALSLCDLPVNVKDHDYRTNSKSTQDSEVIETQEDFDFRSLGGHFFQESEMCAADEVFFQGQILPLHLSLTVTTPCFQRDVTQLKRCESRSESFDNGSVSEFRSNSSRSSSLRSQNSSSSSSSTATTTSRISRPRIHNQFHTHPSPQPQLKATPPRQTNFGNQGRKSSAWEFFRLGVAPAPEIGLLDLKARGNNSANKNPTSPNSSSSNSGNNDVNAKNAAKSVKSSCNTNHSGKIHHVFKQFVGKGGGLWGGCQCSVETVQSDRVIIKGGAKSANKTESITHAMKGKGKVLELKRQKHREKLEKRTMSRRRTFEWIKELSHANYPDEEALLSNSSNLF